VAVLQLVTPPQAERLREQQPAKRLPSDVWCDLRWGEAAR